MDDRVTPEQKSNSICRNAATNFFKNHRVSLSPADTHYCSAPLPFGKQTAFCYSQIVSILTHESTNPEHLWPFCCLLLHLSGFGSFYISWLFCACFHALCLCWFLSAGCTFCVPHAWFQLTWHLLALALLHASTLIIKQHILEINALNLYIFLRWILSYFGENSTYLLLCVSLMVRSLRTHLCRCFRFLWWLIVKKIIFY